MSDTFDHADDIRQQQRDQELENSRARNQPKETLAMDSALPSTTIGARINNSKRLYTYQCARPVEVGDRVNIKLPHGGIQTVAVEEVHPEPQLSDRWETKWCVVVQTKAEYEASLYVASELGSHLGL